MIRGFVQLGLLFASVATMAEERALVRLQGHSEGRGIPILRWEMSLDGRKCREGGGQLQVPEGHRLVVKQAGFTVRGGRVPLKRSGHFVLFQAGREGRADLAEVTGGLHPGLPSSTVLRRFEPGLVIPAGCAPGVAWGLDQNDRSTLSVILYGWLIREPGPHAPGAAGRP